MSTLIPSALGAAVLATMLYFTTQAMAHFIPDPCQPQPHHQDSGKCATEHDTHDEEAR